VLNLVGAALVYSPSSASSDAFDGAHAIPARGDDRTLAKPTAPCRLRIGFCILFAFIGTFTYVNFVLVRTPLSLG